MKQFLFCLLLAIVTISGFVLLLVAAFKFGGSNNGILAGVFAVLALLWLCFIPVWGVYKFTK